jgi:hypothetical protein
MIKYFLTFIIILFSFSQEKVIALRVDFQKDNSEFTTGDGSFNLRNPDLDSVKNIIIDPAPHNRSYFSDHLLFAKNYLKKFLDLDITYEVYPSAENEVYHLSKKMFFYNPNTKEDSLRGLLQLYVEAYGLAENAGVQITSNDIVVIFHAGTGNDIFLDIDYTPHDIPSVSLNKEFVKKFNLPFYNSGKSIRGVILPETASQEGFELAMNGLVVANIATQIGFLDLVDPVKRQSVVGPWSVEDRGLFNANGLLPSIPSAVNRYLFNLRPNKTDTVLPYSVKQTITVDAISDVSNSEIIYIPVNDNEYYLVENRQRPIYQNDQRLDLNDLRIKFTPLNSEFLNFKEILLHQDFQYKDRFEWSDRGVLINTTEYDAAIPHSGLLIWKLDKRQIARFKETNKLNSEEHFRGAQLIEADGVDNLNTNIGGDQEEKNDLFYSANKGKFYTNSFNSNSLPHTKSFYENALTGLSLSNFSNVSASMSFDIQLESKMKEDFAGNIQDLFTSSDSTYLIYTRGNLLIRNIYTADMQFLQKDSIQTNGISGFKYENNRYFYYSNDSLFQTNFINNTFLGITNTKIKMILGSYLLDESESVYLINNDLLITEMALKADTIIKANEAIVARSSVSGRYHHLVAGNSTEININSENLLSKDDHFYELSFNSNNVSARNSLAAMSYDFPRNVYYSFKEQSIIEYREIGSYAITRDKINIYKIFPAFGETNNQQSIYTGSKIDKLLVTNDLLVYISGNSIYHEKLNERLKNLATAPNYSSNDIFDAKRTFLWPNPNLDDKKINIRIFSSSAQSLIATVFQSDGRYLEEFKINIPANIEYDYSWDVKDLPSGTYIILLKNNNFEKILKAAVVH